MRLVHTSDWHVGARLREKERTREHAAFLEELDEIVREEKIDAVLVAGDIFDSTNPSPEAEKLVFDFFRKTAERKVSVVLIAGNHDSGDRVEGRARLLELVEIHAFGLPRRDAAVEVITRKNESLVVAALPFTGELRLLNWDETSTHDPKQQKTVFAERMKQLLSILSQTHFKTNAVNILMAHLTIDGAILSGSEKSLRMSETWTVPASMLPGNAHYMALGHIHKPQILADAPLPAYYSGSPLHINFGEEKDQKGIYLLDAAPGKPVEITFRPLQRITPLKTLRVNKKGLPLEARRMQDFEGHLKVVVSLEQDEQQTGLAEEVRKLLPQVLSIECDRPKPERRILPNLSAVAEEPLQAYRLYLESQDRELTPGLSEKFEELLEEASHASS